MFKVNRNSIYLTRGDSAFISITLMDNKGRIYEWQEGDCMYFRVKQSAMALSILLEKVVVYNSAMFEFVVSDTAGLDFGTYRYEVELVTATGQHYTVIENAVFEVGPELENH